MSVLLTAEEGWIISHSRYLDKIYKNVKNSETLCSLEFDKTFFDINSQFLRDNQLFKSDKGISKPRLNESIKRKRSEECSEEDSIQISHVKGALLRIQSLAAAKHLFQSSNIHDNNAAARAASINFYSERSSCRSANFHGANDSPTSIVAEIDNGQFVLPENSSFYAYDVKEIGQRLDRDRRYDFILVDPPWWNKFVRRKKKKFVESSYNMMYNKDFAKIPIHDLLGSTGIVAVWCTNAPSHFKAITNEMFPSWGVTYVAKWYWVKVTQSGNPICNFNTTARKQPYELLIFGQKSCQHETTIPNDKLIVSVPSSIHSHKPPIAEIIEPYLRKNPKCLEIFARYLLPDWTSWGLEVLKLQHLSLYNIVKRGNDDR